MAMPYGVFIVGAAQKKSIEMKAAFLHYELDEIVYIHHPGDYIFLGNSNQIKI